MQRKAYWIGNFIVDFVKILILVLTTIACFFGFSMQMENASWAYLALPFAVLPFTYVTSFMFSSESSA
jgi:hypothetical protein